MRRPNLSPLALALTLAAASPATAAVTVTTLISGVSEPTAFIDPPDGLPHRFVVQKEGDILVWDGTSLSATPFLDLRNDVSVPVGQRKVQTGSERGLLAMVLHPQYKTNGFFYLYYTSTNWDGAGGINQGDIVIERYTVDPGNPALAQPASAQIVLVVPHPDFNHNGGDVKFGPDGFLYIALGDGGGGCDSTAGSGQDPNQYLGKMLRLDVDGADAFPADPLKNYAIPASNPLVGVAGLDEIWALGLRNPFRFNFDRSTGAIYIGDVGQDDWEEVNLLSPGAVTPGNPVNFGWPCREGFVPAGCGTPPQGCGATFTDPVRAEPNAGEGGSWRSVMGGFLYRGSQTVADLGGRYLYGDASNGQLWLATPGGSPWASTQVASSQFPFGFAEDQLGELYVLSASGSIRCVHDGGGCTDWATLGDIFLDGFESGDTSAWSSVVP
jgi:glucose/arabinose dehydrogenase